MCGQLEGSRLLCLPQTLNFSAEFSAMAASFTTATRQEFLLTVSTVITHFLTLKLNTLKWRTARIKHAFSVYKLNCIILHAVALAKCNLASYI